MNKIAKYSVPAVALLGHWSAHAQGLVANAAAAVASSASGPATGTDGRVPIFTWAVIFAAGVAVGYVLGSMSAKNSNKQS